MECPSAPACLPHLPRMRPGAEAERPVPKSILIGAPIPYAERPSARSHGEAPGRTVTAIVLLLRSYLAQDGWNGAFPWPLNGTVFLFAACETLSKSL